MSNSTQIIKVLKEYGVTFSKKRIINITENGRGYEWFEFCNMLDKLGDKEYMESVLPHSEAYLIISSRFLGMSSQPAFAQISRHLQYAGQTGR